MIVPLLCGQRIPSRPHQSPSVRACSPGCAGTLYKREHPHAEAVLDAPDDEPSWKELPK